MTENGKMINLTDMVSFMIISEIDMLDNGKMESNMVILRMNSKMVVNLTEHTNKAKKFMGKQNMKTGRFTQVHGQMENLKVKVNIFGLME